MRKLLFAILCMMVLGTACNKNEESLKTIDEISIKQLQKHKDTFVGNNSAVGSIVNSLPGGFTNKEFELFNQSVKVKYHLNNHISTTSEEKLYAYWLSEGTLQKNFLYNATAILILVKNAEKVTLELDAEKSYSFSISRAELEKELPHPLTQYAENESLWKEEIVNNLMKQDEKRQAFFKKYPIQQS
ncbi:DUF4825 domain-containing protein [Microbacteriaceae bacterium 4G12]